MNLYALTLEKLLGLSITQAWPELQAVLRHGVDRQDRHWQIPVIVCEAVGGNPEQALAAVAAIACLQISLLLIDDLLDADPRGEYHRLGEPVTANLAAALQAMSLEVLAQAEVPVPARLAALQNINCAALTTAAGQQWDVHNPADEAAYWHIVEMKSSPFFSVAVYLGAVLGGASVEIAELLKQWGSLYGEMIQIHDDLNDALAVPANPDWTLGRTSLPILFAQSVEYPEREHFLELQRQLQAAPKLETLMEAQTILIRCGAVSYSLEELFARHALAQRGLDQLSLPQRAHLDHLLEDLIEPVNKLLATCDQPW